jgi:hypothetical protein
MFINILRMALTLVSLTPRPSEIKGIELFIWNLNQGCQMVSFQTKNPNLGKISRALYVMEKGWYILWQFLYNTAIWYILHMATW